MCVLISYVLDMIDKTMNVYVLFIIAHLTAGGHFVCPRSDLLKFKEHVSMHVSSFRMSSK